ncbi:MAG: plasmid recombination protein [Candidatus Azobacteroides sp.]|nr:plasmid recombination protein [Candidatus Azobacteroides sp.]
MGFAVLHIQKPKGNDARTTAHIERTVQPGNADPERKELNKEFIRFPDGVENRTQAIQHRIENAEITRKIRENQVRALQVMLLGTPEDMQRIQNRKIDDWCRDNIEWLKDTFGKENIVSAVLHMDEKTPHIHATVVPIVAGERRKAKQEENNGKKKYRKKPKDTVRLCADDVMTRDNLERFQDTYAKRMRKYGLQRGIKGSDARHISTPQYYRELFAQNEDLKENIEYLQEEKQEVYEKVQDMYDRKDEAREKFMNMHEYPQQKEAEISDLETRIEQLKQKYEPYRGQDDINLLFSVFPQLSERLRIAQLCKGIGLTIDAIKQLFTGEAVTMSGKLHSPEHNQSFSVQDAKLQLFKESKNSERLKLSINGHNIIEWFKEQFVKLRQTVRPNIKPTTPTQNKG